MCLDLKVLVELRTFVEGASQPIQVSKPLTMISSNILEEPTVEKLPSSLFILFLVYVRLLDV